MVSTGIILTSSMRSNLSSLRTIAAQMDKTQNILSTGKKVNSAIDNASSYYQARSLSNRAADLNRLLDDMCKGIQVLQAANEGLESATAYLEQMKSVAEQATGAGTGMLTSQVKLVDNSAELIAQGYIGVSTADEFKAALQAATEDTKIVLMNDIEIDFIPREEPIIYSGVTINGGGHTLKFIDSYLYLEGNNITIENIRLDCISDSGCGVIGTYRDPKNITLRNIDINYSGSGYCNLITFGCGDGTIENVNINATSVDDICAISSHGIGDLNIKNLTINISSEKGNVFGISFCDENIIIDGMSIKAQGNRIIGSYSWGSGTISGVEKNEEFTLPSYLFDGKANTKAIVNQLGTDGKAAYATTQFYVGDKNGAFGQGNWYLPSIGELMDLYGTGGDNMTAINTTLGELYSDGIAEEMNGWYWSSSEVSSDSAVALKTTRAFSRIAKDRFFTAGMITHVRSFLLYENCFNPSLLSGAEGDGIPKVGDIMYQDGSWGTLDEYKSARNPSEVAGVICGVGDDGSVKVVSLKDLTFSERGDAGVFNPENPYGGSVKYVQWATSARAQENIEAITDVEEILLEVLVDSNTVISVNDINKSSMVIDTSFYKEEFNKIIAEYDKLISDVSYQGINLLTGGELKVTFNKSRTNDILIKGQYIRSEKIGLNKAEWNSSDKVKESIKEVQDTIDKLRSFADSLGNNYQVIQTRQNFTEALAEVLEEGADGLVLADMNEASAEYLMLQTRQQLAVNSLSLASQSASSILSLF